MEKRLFCKVKTAVFFYGNLYSRCGINHRPLKSTPLKTSVGLCMEE